MAKELAREALRASIEPHVRDMVHAQVSQAKGIKYLVLRDSKTGQFTRITEKMLKSWKDGKTPSGELVEVWQKDPSTAAFTDLMNRYVDKPKESLDVAATGDWEKLAARLQSARRRVEGDEGRKDSGD